jgi:hypothetical protein
LVIVTGAGEVLCWTGDCEVETVEVVLSVGLVDMVVRDERLVLGTGQALVQT